MDNPTFLPTGDTCRYCHAPLVESEPTTFGGRTFQVYKPCLCDRAREERERAAESKQQEVERMIRAARLKSLRKRGVEKRYLGATTDLAVEGLYLVGNVGTGKTHTASALAIKAYDSGQSVYLRTFERILDEVKATYSNDEGRTADSILQTYEDVDVLILDDIGKETPTDHNLGHLFRLINTRYSREKVTILTSQMERNELALKLGGDGMAQAIVSRLMEMCRVVRFTGADRRLAHK